MRDRLEIRLLGPFEVLTGGRRAEVSGSKRHALLAMLALRRGRVVDIDALVGALWGEDLPAAPRNAIQHHVTRLRAALGHESILASPNGYALEDAAVDALRFEELLAETRAALREGDVQAAADSVASALALWRGPALHGLTETTWFSTEARRLEALRFDALEEQFEVALARGEHREVAPALRAALEESPFRERLWGQLMLALYRSGRQADALETFQDARRVLAEELGLEPGPDLRRLQEAILAHDPAIAAVPVVASRRGNLPAPAASFVGREDEIARVVELLREHRLVTLTGPPGVGKSRLALEALRSLESEIADGIWFVDLARAAGAADVVRLVARALDARGSDPLARVVARLRLADALLVLDGCGGVVGEAGRVAAAVLTECAGVRVLATSREVLHVPGEVRLSVEPLPLPPRESDSADAPAVRLFLARARAVRPEFELTAEAAQVAAEIVRRVDGLPLGIELAAARLNVLGLAELLSIVERRLALLRQRPATDPSRAALGALVEWSYDLLHEDEKTLLQQLAVHRGGASLASLAAVAAGRGLDEATVAYLLGALVDKSIVSVSFPDGAARYDLLNTVREYVTEHLREVGALARTQEAHAEHFAALADAARAGLRGRDWLAWTRRLELENDNLWAALAYAREGAEPALPIRLAAPLGWYFALVERVSEGRRFLELALAATSEEAPDDLLVELQTFLCYLAMEELDLDAALAAGERALALAADTGGRWLALVALALAVAQSGDGKRAAALVEEARVGYADAADVWGLAASNLVAAQVAVGAGDVSTVSARVPEVLRHSQAIGYDAFEIPARLLEAWEAERRNDVGAAAEAFRHAFELSNRAGFADHASFALTGLSSCSLAGGDLRDAEELARRALDAAEATREDWAAAHARVQLARVLTALRDTETAESLYQSAVECSKTSRPHRPRESLFRALADTPATAALHGLAELAEARGDVDAAADFRGRAELALV